MENPVYPEKSLSRAYLNTPSNGLMSERVGRAGELFFRETVQNGFEFRESCVARTPEVRALAARLLGTESGHVALLGNFSTAMNQAAAMLRPLKKVLLYRHDFPSLTLPWLANGYEAHFFDHNERLELELDRIESALRQNGIPILAVSWVQYATGFRLDLGELSSLCRRLGVLLLVDGSQGLGALRVDPAWELDLLAGSGYKWICAGMGSGFVRLRQELLETYRLPALSNAHLTTFRSFERYEDVPISVQALEIGHPAHAGQWILREALEELFEIGIETIEAHNLALTNHAKRRLAEEGIPLAGDFSPKNTGPILVIQGDEKRFRKLWDAGIRCSWRGFGIRVGFHHYNTEADVEALIEALAQTP